MIHGPSSHLYLPRPTVSDIVETERALWLALDGVEAVWLTSQGHPLFKIDLSGVVDDKKRISRYLKVRQ